MSEINGTENARRLDHPQCVHGAARCNRQKRYLPENEHPVGINSHAHHPAIHEFDEEKEMPVHVVFQFHLTNMQAEMAHDHMWMGHDPLSPRWTGK